jgi:predicted MPP superfamily phosphohydrolase
MKPTESRPMEQWKTICPGLEKKIGPGVATGPWFQYADAIGFEWNTYRVVVPNLPAELNDFRIVQLSDLHCQPHWQTAYDDLIDRLKARPPDLITITGDIIDDILHPWPCVPTAKKLINALTAKIGTFGIFGNHDVKLSPAALGDTLLHLIDGKQTFIESAGRPLELIATPGPERENYPRGFELSLPAKQPGVPRIVLSHYPDHFRRMQRIHPDIFLSGHTHGGQACLPGGIALLRHDSLPLSLLKGVHRLHRCWYFVNRGFGFSTMQFRMFCPAEVIEIRLMQSLPRAD